jgi:hypothetical protein
MNHFPQLHPFFARISFECFIVPCREGKHALTYLLGCFFFHKVSRWEISMLLHVVHLKDLFPGKPKPMMCGKQNSMLVLKVIISTLIDLLQYINRLW